MRAKQTIEKAELVMRDETRFYPVPVVCVCLLLLVLPGSILGQDAKGEHSGMSDVSLSKLMDLKISLASMYEQNLTEAPSIVAVITREELEALGVRSFDQAIRMLAGFDSVLNSVAGDFGFSVRGILSTNATNNTIKLYLNGHALQGPAGGAQYILDYFPMRYIEQIEVIRGPGSSLYGANAFVSVINIITSDEEDFSYLTLEGGSHSLKSGTLFYASELGGFNFSIMGSFFETDGESEIVEQDLAYNALGPAFTAAPAPSTTEARNANIHAVISNGNFSFTTFYNRLNRNNAVGISGALTDETDFQLDSVFVEMKYENEINETFSFLARGYYDFFGYAPVYEVFSEETAALFSALYSFADPYPEGDGIIGSPNLDFDLFGAETTLYWTPSSWVQILGGFLFDRSRIYNPTHVANGNVSGSVLVIDGQEYLPLQYLGGMVDLTNIEGGNWILGADRENFAAYVQGVFNLKERLFPGRGIESLGITVGARYDDYSDFGSTTNPRMSFVFAPTKSMFLKIMRGEAFRAPTMDELYQINNPSFLGNPNLKPEKLETNEFQIGFQDRTRFSMTASYYQTKIDNNISTVVKTFQNVGKILAEGFEFESRYVFNDADFLFVNYTWQETKNTTNAVLRAPGMDGQEITYVQPDYDVGYIPDTLINAGFRFEFFNWLSWGVLFNHGSERDRSGEQAFLMFDNGTPDPSDDYTDGQLTLVDPRPPTGDRTLLSSTFSFFVREFKIQLGGYNLLDDDYRDPDPSSVVPLDLPRDGTTFRFSLKYEF